MTRLVFALKDTWTLAVRTLKHNFRSPDTIMTALAMPVMILLVFVFVLGGAMETGAVAYVDFVVPVVALMCVAMGVSYTAFRVNLDVTSGMFARFRAMPIARSALLGGHVAASVVVNAVSLAILGAIAFLIGFRPQADLAGWALATALLALVLAVFSTMGVAFGLAAKTNEGAGMFSYAVIGLLFVSSGFAPTATMPAPVRAFADHQPMTAVIDALRGAALGHPAAADTGAAFAWLVAMLVVFAAFALWANRASANRPH
ncbi:MAG: ABC transporter permease [Bifidobacteriaceae bacterium]|jgi:ABC-2 type transport system permease protein|nr:ABC transporter permease [Bifidobacteriaceae bacterium]